jgi:mRNA deadenylase 3'-5' endonuclease subunit Ccr4
LFLTELFFATVFATKEKYFYCAPAHLDWSYRRRAIVDKLQSMDADIICLQEVQIDTWESDLLQYFTPEYTGILQTVTRGHPVACAVLVRNETFQVVATESRSRALILVLQEVATNSSSNTLFLANVHLEAGNGQDETRFCQVKSLLKRLRNHVTTTVTPSATTHDNDEPCILLAGDFNMLNSNPVHSLLSSGVWNPDDGMRQTRASRGSKKKTTIISRDVDVALARQQFPLLPMRELFDTTTSTVATSRPTTTTALGTTFAGGSVLDYIWVSAGWKSVTPWIVDDRVLQRLYRTAWPSADNPSDHLPIGAHFGFGE